MNIKNEKGVTLVALVVTIIVMIILASIAISASIEDNGVVNQTKDSIINASEREVEEALEVKLLLKEKEEIRKGNLEPLTMKDLTGSDTTSDDTDDILTLKESKTNYNIYQIDISKLDIKGDYGKGATSDYFTVQVELDASGNETKNFEVVYVP